ncbi:uncharacterized protein LOC126775731 [Nymphalis io]|uniref:uncharacterized protein LOC126775731 n=1 Tax=Inachis io TaxID=171585 RepID=UPI00216764A2|nr:uncharacterized protein LOC126775731 [Nymphalis io]
MVSDAEVEAATRRPCEAATWRLERGAATSRTDSAHHIQFSRYHGDVRLPSRRGRADCRTRPITGDQRAHPRQSHGAVRPERASVLSHNNIKTNDNHTLPDIS